MLRLWKSADRFAYHKRDFNLIRCKHVHTNTRNTLSDSLIWKSTNPSKYHDRHVKRDLPRAMLVMLSQHPAKRRRRTRRYR